MTLNRNDEADFIAHFKRGHTKQMAKPISWLKKDQFYEVLKKALSERNWTLADLSRAVVKEFEDILVDMSGGLAEVEHSIAVTMRKKTAKSKWWPLCEYVLDTSLNTAKTIIERDLARRIARDIVNGIEATEPPVDQRRVTDVIDSGRRNVVHQTQGRLRHETRNRGPGGSMLIVSTAVVQQSVPAELADVEEAYTVVMSSESMSPAMEPKTTLWINPNAEVKSGLILLTPRHDVEEKEKILFVCLLLKITKEHYIGEQFNPRREVKFSRSLWVAQKIVGHIDPEDIT